MTSHSATDDELRRRLRDLPVFEGDLPTFETGDVPSHPTELFARWLLNAIAAEVREPHAMTVSTVDTDGRPSSRMMILKGLTDGRWQFATSRVSRKAQELQTSPWAAASFYWSELGRQVRVRGKVSEGGPEESARDFLDRPPASRAESLVGHQSEMLASIGDLDAARDEALTRVRADPETVPEHWTSYDLIADDVEFWQADPERRHTRLRYRMQAGVWVREQLWP